MKKRVQSSGSFQALGIFYLRALKTVSSGVLVSLNACNVRTKVRFGVSLTAALLKSRFERASRYKVVSILALCILLLGCHAALADADTKVVMKRRQQGILTGMPFMANIAPRTFVDDSGRKLYFAKAPRRVLSLAPSLTEMLFAIGLDEQIVGVTNFCNYPPAAAGKPKVGYTQPNLESLLALSPDMVAAPGELLRADVLAKLEALKVPTFIFEAKSLEHVLAHIHTLGRIFERSSAADALTRHMRERIAEVSRRVQTVERKRVLYVLSSHPLITVGPNSYIHQMIELAGGINVAAGTSGAYPRLSMETVLEKDPEILVFPVGSTESVPEHEQQTWKRWTGLSAVQRHRLHVVSSDALNRPGPRVVDGLEQLAQVIHPEAFSSDSPPSSRP
jgi:iron complex transport system substrate-binding protein